MTWFEPSPSSGRRRAPSHLSLLVALLLLQFALHSVNISAQEAFVDEGYHVQQNPGQFSEGKFLLYFWLGMFLGPRSTILAASRLSIAMLSLITTTVCTESTTGLAGAGRYLANVMPLVADFVGSGLLRWRVDEIRLRHTLFLIALLFVATAAVIFLSGLPTARYFVPAAVPLCITVGSFVVYLRNVQPVRRLSCFVVISAGLVWLATFAWPVDRAVIAAPLELPLSQISNI